MFAVLVNTIGIILGSLAGCCFRRGISKEMNYVLMQALGLCAVVIGIQGAIKEDNILIMIISAVTGVFIGQYVDADGLVNKFTARIMSRFAKGEGDTAKLVNAFATSCLIMNVGAMVIVGSLDAGLREDYTMLYTKSLLDTIAGVMMTAAMGIGVMGSAFFTLFFQGGIVLLAEQVAPYLSDYVIQEISCTGCLIILALGTNMLELTNIKVINYLPALVMVPLVIKLMNAIGLN